MNWLFETLLQPTSVQAVIIICLVSALGLELGKLKFFNISLGITFVFFTGIVVGHFDLGLNPDMLIFAQNFGLILFIYALGLQVGPSFFSSLRQGGIKLNLLSFGVIAVGTLLMVGLAKVTDVSLTNMMGLFMGAVTNTPALGAAQQAVIQVHPADTNAISDMALACAVAYPLGVVGVILAVITIRKTLPKYLSVKYNTNQEKDTYIAEFKITSELVSGFTIVDLMHTLERRFVISRIWRESKAIVPKSSTILEKGDNLLLICKKADVDYITNLFGEKVDIDWNKDDINWNSIDNSQLSSQHIVVTRSKVNGVKIGSLKLRTMYGLNITRLNRAGINLLPSPDLTLQIGDKLTVVGEMSAIKSAAQILGDEVKQLSDPNLIVIFLGIALGLLLGAIPFPFPGMSMPIKLGIAAGPILVGILMGAFGPKLRITTYATPSASLLMRKLGLVIYLACLGLSSGSNFFETVLQPEGVLWLLLGFLMTVLPVLIVGFIALKLMKMAYPEIVGMLCGSMANPIALDYVNSTVDGDEASVSYATVYPVAMFIRIVLAQMLLLFLL